MDGLYGQVNFSHGMRKMFNVCGVRLTEHFSRTRKLCLASAASLKNVAGRNQKEAFGATRESGSQPAKRFMMRKIARG